MMKHHSSMSEIKNSRMSSIHASRTKIENLVLSFIWSHGIRYRRTNASLLGKPDMAIKKYKIALFVDSCFWHFCPLHRKLPKNNAEYWLAKLTKNFERDKVITEHYEKLNWLVIRIWEHDLKEDFLSTMSAVLKKIQQKISDTE